MAFSSFNQTIPRVRPAAGSYNANGVFVAGAAVADSIQGSIQPAPYEELLTLPEGRRQEGSYLVYTFSAVQTGDILFIRGDRFEVMRIEPWLNNVISHFKVLAVKMQEEGVL